MSYVVYSADPLLLLRDHTGNRSVVKLERVAPLTADIGSGPSFDPMLGRWVGGFNQFLVPISNAFRLTGIPPGTYSFYLYASTAGAPTDFYVAINASPPVLKTAACSGGPTNFVANDNYVAYENLVLSVGDVLAFSASGAFAGVQLLRI